MLSDQVLLHERLLGLQYLYEFLSVYGGLGELKH